MSITARSPLAAEVLTGYLPFPALLSMAAILWTRQLRALRTIKRLADRQRALARLGTYALTAELSDVVAAAEAAVRADATRIGSGDRDADSDEEFQIAIGALVAAARDREHTHHELHRRAAADELTGLANRTRLLDVINTSLRRDGDDSSIAVALCDLDLFRSVTEVHGHAAGDVVLREVARRLVATAGNGDVVGRLAGDEFVVVSSGTAGPDDVGALGRRLASVFDRPFAIGDVQARVTASIGIVTASRNQPTSDAESLIRDADTAMYDAKSRGGAAIGEFHDGLRSAVVVRADLEQRLIGAVYRGEIVVHYQPIIDLRSHRTIGFEALARWQHGDTLLPPDQWISLAESTGLINEIG